MNVYKQNVWFYLQKDLEEQDVLLACVLDMFQAKIAMCYCHIIVLSSLKELLYLTDYQTLVPHLQFYHQDNMKQYNNYQNKPSYLNVIVSNLYTTNYHIMVTAVGFEPTPSKWLMIHTFLMILILQPPLPIFFPSHKV